jgi:multidrug efflux pump subunit AcrA (membrane-fusion protein)
VAQNATGYAVLLADSDGVVMETLAEPGQVVSAGQAVIRLARAGQREALVQLPETLRPAIGSEALATRYGDETQPVAAKLRLLSDAADATTRTFEARYVLEGPLANAPLGATVTLHIKNRVGKARSCRCRWPRFMMRARDRASGGSPRSQPGSHGSPSRC